MTADEARLIQKKAIDRENVDRTIKLINSSIKESAEKGESCVNVSFKDLDIKTLKDVEKKEIAKYFRSNDFNAELMSYDNFFDIRISWL